MKKLSRSLEALVKDIEKDEMFVAPEPWERDEVVWLLGEAAYRLKRCEEAENAANP